MYETTRQRHLQRWGELLFDRIERRTWTQAQLREHRDESLHELLAHARRSSPWHSERLAGIVTDNVTSDDLAALPVMTKSDLMIHFDAIICDPRMSLATAESHLAQLSGDAYLFDELHVVASGGSSGLRGVFAYGWDAWVDVHLGLGRHVIADRFDDPALAAAPPVMSVVAAANATHMTTAAAATFSNDFVEVHSLPVTLPVPAIVDGLNRAQPTSLTVYASMLGVLAAEAAAGRLCISPLRIVTTSEPLLPEVRTAAEEVFGAPVANCWGTSEAGAMAVGCWKGTGMHLNDDLVIVEPVDESGRPVPPGEPSAKVLVTNLFNPLLPLIRYELTDEVTVLEGSCPCGSAHTRIADILGRSDDLFTYPEATVHPHVLRSPLARIPAVAEYQVHQTPVGVDVAVRATADVDTDDLSRQLAAALAGVGVSAPVVSIRVVDAPERNPTTGKLKRFIPLAAMPAPIR